MNSLGIDIGGTFIKFGVVTSEQKLLFQSRIKTPKNLNGLIEAVVSLVTGNQADYHIRAAGIGIPGFISRKDNVIKKSPNMQFLNGVSFHKIIQDQLAMPVVVNNDANTAAFGEYALLNSPRPSSFVHLTLGTGIGSGIIIDDKIWTGECGYAAEMGHIVVNPEGRTCGCGGQGCVESESSEVGIAASYREYSGAQEQISALEIFKRAAAGDDAAEKAFKRAGYYLGILLSVIVNVLNPSLISIGGGVAAAGDRIMGPALAEFKRRIHEDASACSQIVMSEGKNQSGLIGAAFMAQKQIDTD